MKRANIVAGLLALSLASQSASAEVADSVANAAAHAMENTGAKGLAIAVIENGQVRSVQAFGVRNAKGAPLTVDTVMYGASLTKSVFGYLAVQPRYFHSHYQNTAIWMPMEIGETCRVTRAGN
jgi:CubicO group peptidase (beta-lactamase class C family)